MGYGLAAYRVDPASLASLPTRGAPAFASLERRLARAFADVRDSFAEELAEGSVVDPSDALARLAMGKGKPRDTMHGVVTRALCGVLGKALRAGIWERFSSKFFSDLDDELTARGLKGKDAIVRIVQSGVTVVGKRIVDPECGFMPPEQVARVGALLDAMDLGALDADQRAGTKAWRAWMRAAEKHRQGLAIFST